MRYTVPIFFAGMGSALEIYPVPHVYTIRRFPDGLSDAQRLASDWYRVGHALYSVMNSTLPESASGKAKEAVADR